MGSIWSSDQWTIHARLRSTDRYLDSPVATAKTPAHAATLFRTRVQRFAMGLHPLRDYKAIYLYNGVWRMAKCDWEDHQLRLTFRDADTKRVWIESIPPKSQRALSTHRHFHELFGRELEDDKDGVVLHFRRAVQAAES